MRYKLKIDRTFHNPNGRGVNKIFIVLLFIFVNFHRLVNFIPIGNSEISHILVYVVPMKLLFRQTFLLCLLESR